MENYTLDLDTFHDTSRTFPSFSKPKAVGYFSLTQEREYRDSLEQLKYIDKKYVDAVQDVEFDLNTAYERRVPKPASADAEQLDHLLRCIVTNNLPRPEILCFRGLLRLLMCTPYEDREGWKICVSKYKGTIYMCAEETEEKKAQNQNMNEQNKKFCSYGFKFEQYLLTPTPGGIANGDEPVKEGEELCVMFQSKLDTVNLMYGAEMDGVTDTQITNLTELSKANFVELKVKQREMNYRQERSAARFKYIKWWSQSFLVGINDFVIGIRNRNGICIKTEPVKLSNIPKAVEQIDPSLWRPSVCMNFLLDFLNAVIKVMDKADSPYDVYKFTYTPNAGVKYVKYIGKNEFSFLPSFYLDYLKSVK